MTFSPKVSIVIPVYNGSNYMQEAINSALNQTYKNIEVLVINDGSLDEGKTDTIARSYGNKIRYFAKENGGVSTALNLGIKMMDGDYFSWLSHDDVYYPNKIERQIQYLQEEPNKEIILYSNFDFIDRNSNILIKHYMKDTQPPINLFELIPENIIHGCSLLIPKIFFQNAGLFNESLKTTQDYEMWIRLVKKNYVFKFMPEVLIQARIHPQQVTMKTTLLQKETDELVMDVLQYLLKNQQGEVTAFDLLNKAIDCRKRNYAQSSQYAYETAMELRKTDKSIGGVQWIQLAGKYTACGMERMLKTLYRFFKRFLRYLKS